MYSKDLTSERGQGIPGAKGTYQQGVRTPFQNMLWILETLEFPL